MANSLFLIFINEIHCFCKICSVIYCTHMISVGYLQSFFGVYSIRIENIGVRRPASDDIKIIGVAHPHDFRKVLEILIFFFCLSVS